jgi:hypothetical protein
MRFVSHETESDFKQYVTNEFDFGLVQYQDLVRTYRHPPYVAYYCRLG